MQAQTWKLRSLYLLFFAGLGSLNPYLALILSNRGFPSVSIGLLLSISPLVGVFLPPLWGFIADRTRRPVPLIRAQLVALPILVFSLYQVTGHVQIILLLILLAVFLTAFGPLADHVTLEYVQHDGIDYGRVRVFGSIGFSLANLLVSLYLLRHSPMTLYMIYVPVVVLAFILSWWIKERHLRLSYGDTPLITQTGAGANPDTTLDAKPNLQPDVTPDLKPEGQSEVKPQPRRRSPKIRDILPYSGFYLTIFCISLVMPIYYSFFPLYLRNLHFTGSMISISFLLSSGSEVFTMPFATKLYQRIGPKWMLILSALAYTARWLVVGSFTQPIFVLGIQVVHGVAFGFFYTSAVMYVRNMMPKHLLATGQGIFAATTALANVAGNIEGGILFDHLSAHAFFLIQAGISLLAAAMYYVYRFRSNEEIAAA